MILEKQLEGALLSAFNALPELSACQIVCSRDIADVGRLNEQDTSSTIVAVATGFRAHQAFSLSPIDIPVTVSIASRIEEDATAEQHEQVVEAIANKLSRWHFNGALMEAALSTPKFVAGELKMDGGTGRTVDQGNKAYSDSISFTVRGTEVFTE